MIVGIFLAGNDTTKAPITLAFNTTAVSDTRSKLLGGTKAPNALRTKSKAREDLEGILRDQVEFLMGVTFG